MSDEALDLLRTLVAQNDAIIGKLVALPAAIAAAIELRRVPRRLSRTDEAALVALLPAIAAAVRHRTFSVRELMEHAKLEIGPAIALRAALASFGDSPHRIGRLLRRCEGMDVDGFQIVASGPSREGMLRTIVTLRRETRPGG